VRDVGTEVIEDATYYTITDAEFFVGTVALLNSLRLTGHQGEMVVLDCGLTSAQRKRLAPHSRIVPVTRESDSRGLPIKPFAWRPDVDGVVVMIDSDILVTGSLDALLLDAANGRIAMFVDLMATLVAPPNRSFPEWRSALRLAGPLRYHQPYLNAGLIAFSVAAWPHLVDRWREACQLAAGASAGVSSASLEWSEDPFAHSEQDALNAILMSEIAYEALASYDYELAPITQARDSVRLRDPDRLRCVYNGRDTLVLHHTGRPKPWGRRAWAVGPYSAFVDLLPRVLFGKDVVLRPEPSDVPIWLRSGARGKATRIGARILRTPVRAGSAMLPTDMKARISSQLRQWASAQPSHLPPDSQ
jgi:hypothetical protein